MGVLNPLMLLFGLLAVPLVAMYFIKYRFKDTPVPSTYLWDMVTSDKSSVTKFERFRNNKLMWIQLVILLLLVLALSGLFIFTSKEASGDVLILIDNGIVMGSKTGSDSTNLDKATREAKKIVEGASEGTRITLISANKDLEIILSDEISKDRIIKALSEIEESIYNIDKEKLIKAYKNYKSSKESSTVFTFTSLGSADIGDTIYRYGEFKSNVGITDMQTYKDKYVINLTGYGEGTKTVEVVVKVDDDIIKIHEVEVNLGEDISITGEFNGEGSYLSAYIDNLDDISIDNVAMIKIPTYENVDVFLKSSGNSFLREALLLRDDISLVDSLGEETFPENMDVYIFEGDTPSETPQSGGILIINPQSNSTYFTLTDKEGGVTVQTEEDEITSFVQPFYLGKYKSIEATGMKSVANAGDDSVIRKGMMGNSKAIVVGFDIMDTNLPLKYSFPILVQNMISYLSTDIDKSIVDEHIADKIDMEMDYADKDIIETSSANQKKGTYNTSWILAILALIILVIEMEVFRREY